MCLHIQLYDKMEEISIADQTDVRKELGQCSHAVKEVCKHNSSIWSFQWYSFGNETSHFASHMHSTHLH